MTKRRLPYRALVVDIETLPLELLGWKIREENFSPKQIKKDFAICAVAANWLDCEEVLYRDNRHKRDPRDDKSLCLWTWRLLNRADIIITKNGKRFDVRKLNARFYFHDFKPYSTFQHIDLEQVSRKNFGFTSQKLEWISRFNNKYQKSDHGEFPGFDLWDECLKKNLKAWQAMEEYNKFDVLATKEAYFKMMPWDHSVNFSIYYDEGRPNVCSCGNDKWHRDGVKRLKQGNFQRYACTKCGHEKRGRINLLDSDHRKKILLESGR